ncbi:26028_t:CDS:2, partial [Racocetra persica]
MYFTPNNVEYVLDYRYNILINTKTMSKFKTTPPLVSLCAVNTAQEVEIRLHEPLIQKPGSRKKRIGLQVLNALARLEVLLNKEEALASSENEVQHLAQ